MVGALLGQRFASGELTRNELFITSKLAHPAAPPHINISHHRTWDADKGAARAIGVSNFTITH